MALKAGEVTYKRPNRTKPRVFTEKDVGRIARYCKEDGGSDLKILALVAVNLKLGWIFCVAANSLSNVISILNVLAKVGSALAVSRLIDFILTVLTSGAFKRLAKVKGLAAIVVVLIAVGDGLKNSIEKLIDDTQTINKVHEVLKTICEITTALSQDDNNVVDNEIKKE